jgi:inner membrane protein
MNAREHILGGIIATSLTYLTASAALGEPATLAGLLTAGLFGVPTGLALDLLEPADHPHHRGPAHSTVAFAGLVALANKTWTDPTTPATARVWAMVLLAGIGSHHVLDATTPRGLPVTGIRF